MVVHALAADGVVTSHPFYNRVNGEDFHLFLSVGLLRAGLHACNISTLQKAVNRRFDTVQACYKVIVKQANQEGR